MLISRNHNPAMGGCTEVGIPNNQLCANPATSTVAMNFVPAGCLELSRNMHLSGDRLPICGAQVSTAQLKYLQRTLWRLARVVRRDIHGLIVVAASCTEVAEGENGCDVKKGHMYENEAERGCFCQELKAFRAVILRMLSGKCVLNGHMRRFQSLIQQLVLANNPSQPASLVTNLRTKEIHSAI